MDENLPQPEELSTYDSQFTGQPVWICQWSDTDGEEIKIGGENVGVLAEITADNNSYAISTRKVKNDNN